MKNTKLNLSHKMDIFVYFIDLDNSGFRIYISRSKCPTTLQLAVINTSVEFMKTKIKSILIVIIILHSTRVLINALSVG